MKQFKRAQVIMLPTENNNEGLYLNPIPSINKIHYWNKRISNSYIAQHLYIISDDEIKEGDWFILNNEVKQLLRIKFSGAILVLDVGNESIYAHKFKDAKKIIATTDTSLKIESEIDAYYRDGIGIQKTLPQPSQQFIEKYIECYNKGEVITDVLVEYERMYLRVGKNAHLDSYEPKVNPKDNTITIKKLKNSWNRNEVTNLLILAWATASAYGNKTDEADCMDWIKHNLK